MIPFYSQAKTFKIDVTATASTSKSLNNSEYSTVRIINDSYSTVFLSIGNGDQVATLPSTTAAKTCTPILGQSDITLSIPIGIALNISAICKASETATIYVQVGEGI